MDSGGYAKTVPAGTSGGLAMAPDSLSEAYTRYLEDGSGDFAPGAQTSRLRESRKARANQTALRTDFEDQPAQPPQFTPVTLRTKDGGAMVFFASHHYEKQTAARGYRPPMKDALVKELMKGEAKQSATYTHVSQQSVAVPPKSGGDVRFLNRIYGVTAAQGQ
jgi:hypothetical protein